MPVASMATWVTCSAFSQSRSSRNPWLKAENSRTFSSRFLPSPGLRTHAVTVFWCTSSPVQRSTTTSMAPPSSNRQQHRTAARGPQAFEKLTLVLEATKGGAYGVQRQAERRARLHPLRIGVVRAADTILMDWGGPARAMGG